MKLKKKTIWNKLWKVTSELVRLRYADKSGLVECYTCGSKKHYKQMHAGHFIKRNHKSVFFDIEMNIRPQCTKCNTFYGGRQDEFAARLIREFGYKKFLNLMNRKHEIKNWSTSELIEMLTEREKELNLYRKGVK